MKSVSSHREDQHSYPPQPPVCATARVHATRKETEHREEVCPEHDATEDMQVEESSSGEVDPEDALRRADVALRAVDETGLIRHGPAGSRHKL